MKEENVKLSALEQAIGYEFRNKDLLHHAMIHSSYTNEHRLNRGDNNERLEFLGDAVLDLSSSDFLYKEYSDKPEGELTKLRASIVCEPTLAYCARDIKLGQYLFLGKGEDAEGGRTRDSILSDAFEALIGAIYLDGGFANAKKFVLRFVMNDLEHKTLFYDSKTILQEMVQAMNGKKLSYELIGEEGPDHAKTFHVRALIGGIEAGVGKGRTKKAAEQMAAYNTILALREKEPETCS